MYIIKNKYIFKCNSGIVIVVAGALLRAKSRSVCDVLTVLTITRCYFNAHKYEIGLSETRKFKTDQRERGTEKAEIRSVYGF